MAVSHIDLAVVRESLPTMRRHLEGASEAFYVNLFALEPELQTLFPPEAAGRGVRFASALLGAADLLDNPPAFAAGLERLAAKAQAGVRAAHFAPMGFALLVTLGEAMGAAFTRDVQQAWRAAYDHVAAELIRRGAFA